MTPTTTAVLAGADRWAVEQGDALEYLRAMPDDAVALVFFSPPYTDRRTYGIGADRKPGAWVEWMREVVRESCRVSAGLVAVNVSDGVEDCRYGGGPEFLFADLLRLDKVAACRPYIWVKSGPDFDSPGNGQPGSGGRHFHRNDYEPVYVYADPAKLPPRWSDSTAFGRPPQHPRGGRSKGRNKNGTRKAVHKDYEAPDLSNPGNVIRVAVGGGRLGHPLAHDSEAPMPVGVAERFVCWFVPPEGVVLDPFVGSGTTIQAALTHNRRGIGCDLRPCQVELAHRRLRTVTPALC